MQSRGIILTAFVLLLFSACASAASLAYVVSDPFGAPPGEFGTLDLTSGAFQQIGPEQPNGYYGLALGPNGSLVSATYTDSLVSIDPATGVASQIGAISGLNAPAQALGGFDGKIYVTDTANSVYTVNPASGTATLLAGNSGIPATPFALGSSNPDGTLNLADEAIWQSGGKLYATYDAWVAQVGPNGPSLVKVDIAPTLYEIDPTTGVATAIGPTALGIGAVADVNGTDYAFDNPTTQIVALDLATGSTTVVGNFNPAVGVIGGAAPVPEPGSFALLGVTLLGFGICCHRQLRSRKAREGGA